MSLKIQKLWKIDRKPKWDKKWKRRWKMKKLKIKKKSKFLKKTEKKIENFEIFKKFKNFVFCHFSKKWSFLKKSENFWKIFKVLKKLIFLKKIEKFQRFFEFHQLYLILRQMKGNRQFEAHNTTIPRTEDRVWHDRWFHVMASCVKTAPHGDPR